MGLPKIDGVWQPVALYTQLWAARSESAPQAFAFVPRKGSVLRSIELAMMMPAQNTLSIHDVRGEIST